MSTTAAFFVGMGSRAQFLGGQHSDGYPKGHTSSGISESLLCARSEKDFRMEVANHLATLNSDNVLGKGERNWKNGRAEYIYSFQKSVVWITHSGGTWYNPYRTDMAPPKNSPPKPVGRRGSMSGGFRVECGKCCASKSITMEQLIVRSGRATTIGDVEKIFEDRGFKKTSGWSWLCRDCR